jgi:hypothetical protein
MGEFGSTPAAAMPRAMAEFFRVNGLELSKVGQVDKLRPLRSLFFLPLHNHLKKARPDGQNSSKISCGPLDKPRERIIFEPDKAHQRSMIYLSPTSN